MRRLRWLKKDRRGDMFMNPVYIVVLCLMFLTIYSLILAGFVPFMLNGNNYNYNQQYEQLRDSFSVSEIQSNTFYYVDGNSTLYYGEAKDFVVNTHTAMEYLGFHVMIGNYRLYQNPDDPSSDKVQVYLCRNQSNYVNPGGYNDFYYVAKYWGAFSFKTYLIPFNDMTPRSTIVAQDMGDCSQFSIQHNMNNSGGGQRTDITLVFDKPLIISFSFDHPADWKSELWGNRDYNVTVMVDKQVELKDQSNMWAVLGKILTFQLPNMDPVVQLLLAVPIYTSIAVVAFVLFTRLIP